jgi:hypothetical protein
VVELAALLLVAEPDLYTLGQLLIVCERAASADDAQALAVLQSLAVRFADEQVSRMVTAGAIDA